MQEAPRLYSLLCDWSLQHVRQYILEFVSPISMYHSINLMGAIAVVWNDRRQRGALNSKRVGQRSFSHLAMLGLLIHRGNMCIVACGKQL